MDSFQMSSGTCAFISLIIITFSNAVLAPAIYRYNILATRKYVAGILSPIIAMTILLMGR